MPIEPAKTARGGKRRPGSRVAERKIFLLAGCKHSGIRVLLRNPDKCLSVITVDSQLL